jgi:hypothetical protein
MAVYYVQAACSFRRAKLRINYASFLDKNKFKTINKVGGNNPLKF